MNFLEGSGQVYEFFGGRGVYTSVLAVYFFKINRLLPSLKSHCYASQLKYAFRLEGNVSRVMGQNSLTL